MTTFAVTQVEAEITSILIDGCQKARCNSRMQMDFDTRYALATAADARHYAISIFLLVVSAIVTLIFSPINR